MAPTKSLLARSAKLRTALTLTAQSVLTKSNKSHVAIPMSSGVDSHSALFTLLELGVKPSLFSFHLEDNESRDFRIARDTAKHFALPFHEVVLPKSLSTLVADVKALAAFGASSKTDFECFWPMWYLLPAMHAKGMKVFFTGHGADSLYCMSRKANQHFKDREDEFREQAFSSKKAFQRSLIEKRCAELGLTYCPIFYNAAVLKVFRGSTSKELHTPVQKAPSRYAFPEHFDQIKVYAHQSFQLGDTGISEHFENLLNTPLNPSGKYRSVVGVYNQLKKSSSVSPTVNALSKRSLFA